MADLVAKLTAIRGIGNTKAAALIAAGVRKLSDLRAKKYQDMLPVEAKYSIKYPIEDELSYDFVHSLINYLPGYLIGVGGYRRQKAILHDVDVVTLKDLDEVSRDLQKLSEKSEKLETSFRYVGEYSVGGTRKRSFVIHFRDKYLILDVFRITKEEKPYAMLHYTGSSQFNIRVRAVAKRQGMKLNQFGLYDKNGELIKCSTEREVLKAIGVTYKAPTARNE
jgi:DNA polymerase/3'-5' exonuclease PolX